MLRAGAWQVKAAVAAVVAGEDLQRGRVAKACAAAGALTEQLHDELHGPRAAAAYRPVAAVAIDPRVGIAAETVADARIVVGKR
jgi:hypothetical protein